MRHLALTNRRKNLIFNSATLITHITYNVFSLIPKSVSSHLLSFSLRSYSHKLDADWIHYSVISKMTLNGKHSHVLDHNILVWHQAIDAVVPSLPPVFWRPLIQQQGGALLKGQLPGRAPNVVKLGNGFNGLALCQRRERIRQVRYVRRGQRHQAQTDIIARADILNDWYKWCSLVK